jgi:Protein of unknown function (DUF2946)
LQGAWSQALKALAGANLLLLFLPESPPAIHKTSVANALSSMSIYRCINRPMAAWLAAFAMLCHGLMPSISKILAANDPVHTAEICHPVAQESTLTFNTEAQASPAKQFSDPKCGYCVVGIAFATPPSFPFQAFIAEQPSTVVRSTSIPNPKSHPPLAAFSRGPPASLV